MAARGSEETGAHDERQGKGACPNPNPNPNTNPSPHPSPHLHPHLSSDTAPSWGMTVFMTAILVAGLAMIAHFGTPLLRPAQQHTQPSSSVHTSTETVAAKDSQTQEPEWSIDDVRFDLFARVQLKPHHAWRGLNHQSMESISVVNWTEQSLQTYIHERRPALFKDSPLKTWQLLEVDLWTLSIRIPVLMGVVKSPHYNLIITDERDAGGMLPLQSQGEAEMLEGLYFWEFLYLVSDPSVYLYYSGPLPYWEHFVPDLKAALSWTDFRIIEAIVEGTNVEVNKTAPSLWLSHPGVTIQARYSEYHTFICQVQGSSRFVLFPPASLRALYLYPHLHVHYQQSQVNFSSPLEQFPLFEQSEPMEVLLLPGDALYIPPYSMYRFEAISTSFIVEVPSASQEQLHLLEAYATFLPFTNITTEEERIISAQVYLVHFLSRVEDITSPRKFVRNLYRKRYSLLYPADALFIQSSGFTCFKEDPERHALTVMQMNKRKVIRTAEFVADAVNDPGVPRAVKLVWSADYVELLARWAMGPERAVLFLRECLSFERLEVPQEEEGPPVLRL